MKRRAGAPTAALPPGLVQESDQQRFVLASQGVGGYGLPLGDGAPIPDFDASPSPSTGGAAAAHPAKPVVVGVDARRHSALLVMDCVERLAARNQVHPTVVEALRTGFLSGGYGDVSAAASTPCRSGRPFEEAALRGARECGLSRTVLRDAPDDVQCSILDLLVQHELNQQQQYAFTATGRSDRSDEVRSDSSRVFSLQSDGRAVDVNGLVVSDTASASGAVFEIASIEDLDRENAKLLGRGAGGRVLRMTHKSTGVVYAVKEITIGTVEAHKQIAAEVSVLWGSMSKHSTTPSPYLVSMKGVFFQDGYVYVAMELMDGSLKDALDVGGPMAEVDLRCLTFQVLKGLHFLHYDQRRLHRDIKPHNLLYRAGTGEVKVSDFGIASEQLSNDNQRSTFCGTSAYMSPERALGGSYSYETDLWSLGVTIIQLATGSLPTDTKAFSVLRTQNDVPTLPSNMSVSGAMHSFIADCFLPPSAATTTIRLLSHPWMAGLNDFDCRGHLMSTFARLQQRRTASASAAAAASPQGDHSAPVHQITKTEMLKSLDAVF